MVFSNDKWKGFIEVGSDFILNVEKGYPEFDFKIYQKNQTYPFKLIRISPYDYRIAEIKFPDKTLHIVFCNGIYTGELNKSIEEIGSRRLTKNDFLKELA